MLTLKHVAAVSALMLAAAACSSAPKADGNDAEINTAAKALEAQAERATNRVIAEIEADAAQEAPQTQ